MTHDEIEVCFCAGRDAPATATCPHHPATGEAHWWRRGFAYTSRLLRAVKAEQDAELGKEMLGRLMAEYGVLRDELETLREAVTPFARTGSR